MSREFGSNSICAFCSGEKVRACFQDFPRGELIQKRKNEYDCMNFHVSVAPGQISMGIFASYSNGEFMPKQNSAKMPMFLQIQKLNLQ